MPSAGLVIGGAARGALPDGHGAGVADGVERLSHATIAFTRGSLWPTNDTPDAPNECPAMPMRAGSTASYNGLYAVSRPSRTRRCCFSSWVVPVVQLLRGAYGLAGEERKKSSAS